MGLLDAPPAPLANARGAAQLATSQAGFKQMSTWRAAALSARSGGTARVAFVGDSITYGYGADSNKETENLCRVWRDMLGAYTGLSVYEGMAAANSDTSTGSVKRSYATYPWSQYVTAQKAAAATANVPIIDVGFMWGGGVQAARSGAFDSSDHVHPKSEGHASIAAAIYRALVPA